MTNRTAAMTEPQTEAGRALMRFMGWGPAWAKKILAIEREAAAPGAAALDYKATWAAFLAWEADAARTGSGMLAEHMVGAAAMLGWLVERLTARAAEPKPPESGT